MKRHYAVFCVFTLLSTSGAVFAEPRPAMTPEAATINIMGLRLGMSPSVSRPIIAAVQPGIEIKVQESVWPDGTKYVSELTGVWEVPNKNNPTDIARREVVKVYFSAPSSGNRSFWIQRSATFMDGQEVSKEATMQALTAKYGTPTDEDRNISSTKWTYGATNAFAGRKRSELAWGNCTDTRFNSSCPDAFLTFDPMTAPVKTLLHSITLNLKDNKYGLASMERDQVERVAARAAAEEKAGKLAGAARF